MRQNQLSAFALCFGWLCCAALGHAQVAPAPAAEPPVVATQPAVSAPAETPATSSKIRFSFKGATISQVVEFFGRATGLPVIWEAPAPEGTIDYISPVGYDMPQALRVLNMILQSKGVMLRVSRDNLYLQKLELMQKEDVPTFMQEIPDSVTPDQIITVIRPMKIALAKPMAEKLKELVAPYGAVTAMEQQNALLITETAANVRRILTIVDQLDRTDPDGVVEIFPIRHAKAPALLNSLKALLSQRVEKYVINQQGQQVKIEEDQMPGLTISADERTNAIIAKGVQNKIDKLREAIELLDVPAADQGRSMSTIAVMRITPAEAVVKLNELFQKVPEKDRPTVVALDDAQKVMIVGDNDAVDEGSMLVRELEGGPIASNGSQSIMTVLPLERATPQSVIAAINGLLNKRQQSALKIVAGVDGKSLVIAGLSSDVDAVKALVPVLDRQAEVNRQVRIVRLATGDPKAIVEQARAAFAVANPDTEVTNLKAQFPLVATDAGASTDSVQNSNSKPQNQLLLSVDLESRQLTLIGPAKAIDSFTNVLKQIESTIVVERESKRFELTNVLPSEIAAPLTSMATQLLLPTDGSQFVQPVIAAIDQLNTLVVTATPAQFTTLDSLIRSLDVPKIEGGAPPVRILQVRIADAMNLANIINNQFNQRSPAERKAKPVNVSADPQTNALIVAAHPDVLLQIEAMVNELNKTERLDTEAREIQVYTLKVARAEDLARTIDEMFPQPPPPLDLRGRPQPQMQKPKPVMVRADSQTNSLIISAIPGALNLTQEMITQLDIDPMQSLAAGSRSIHVLTIENADAAQLAANLEAMFSGPGQPQARPTIRVDALSNSLLVRATDEQFKVIQEVAGQVDKATVASSRQMRIIPVDPSKGTAQEIAQTLQRLLDRSTGASNKVQVISLEELLKRKKVGAKDVPADAGSSLPLWARLTALAIAAVPEDEPDVTIAVDPATNSLIVVGPSKAIDRITALAKQIQDQIPAAPSVIRYITLTPNLDAQAITNLITQALERMTPAGGQPGDVRRRTAVIADAPGNALIVAANDTDFETIADLIAALSRPVTVEFPIRVVTLEHAEATGVAGALQKFFDDRAKLLRRTRGPDNRSAISIMAIESTNTLLVCASDEDFVQVEELVKRFDTAQAAEGLTFRVFQLKHAKAVEIERTVQNLIDGLLYNQADSFFYYWPPRQETKSKKDTIAVRADARLNALIVTGRGSKFDLVEQMIDLLDAPPPEGERKIVKLYRVQNASLETVAEVVREAFNQGRQRRWWEAADPTEIKVRADTASRMIIVSASAREQEEIKAMIAAIDSQVEAPDYITQVIPVKFGRAHDLADSLSRFMADRARATGSPKPTATIVATESANTLLIAGPKAELEAVRELLTELDQASTSAVTVNILKLKSTPAARIVDAINEAFQTKAQQANQQLNIRVDATGNALVIASTPPMFDEIKATVEQLDAAAPAPGQGIFIIDLQNISPDAAKNVIETIGLNRPQPAESMSRLVSEPIKISVLTGRNAVIIVANPADRETIVGLLKAIDAEPALATAEIRIIKLKHAHAQALSQILNQVLRPAEQQADTPMARAVREQVRRIALNPSTPGAAAATLDLTKPIRVIPDPLSNTLIVSSTAANLATIEQLVTMFDQLPITDAVIVQLFPLQNIAAEQFSRIVKEVFAQGKQLGKTTVTKIQGIPEGGVGGALLDEVAISTDERTNTVIVAGSEQAVALVEVLSKRIDSDVTAGWVEPRVIPLRFADAGDLAGTLQSIIVEGASNLPQSTPMQRQIGRLRMARITGNGDGKVLESDVFVPMTRLVIKPEPQMNALVLVGTPDNIEIVSELVKMLDVESASPSNSVRIYPVANASASRLAQTIKQLFDQQVQSKAMRPEDRVMIQADERTNSLVVATSPRSFALLENLLKTLDNKLAPELREIRMIDIKNASATRLATLIQQMMDARLERLRKAQPETADLERATIIADPRTNSLIIAAGNDSFEVIKRLAADLDNSMLGDASLVTVVPMPKGNIERVAQAINQIMQRRYADMPAELRTAMRPLVLTDLRTNSLMVAANPEDLASIQDLVTKLSATPENPAVGINLVTLPASTRAEQIAPRLQRLMADRQASLGAASALTDKVTIEPDLASNSLIVAATEENLEIIRSFVDVLLQADAAGGAIGGREVDVVTLVSSRATDVVDMLNDLYIQEANRTRGPNTVTVTADERTNAVVINAPPGDVRAIKGLISQLDGAKPATVVEIKYIALQSANAVETVSLIENVLSGRGIGARRGSRQATVLKYLREIVKREGEDGEAATQPQDDEAPVEMEVSAAIRESISLTPDLRTNTIIVSAPRESITMIERMIRDLDQSSTGAKNIRIFKLKNADALAMAQIITDLFSLKQGRSMYVLKPREDGTPMFAPPPGGGNNGAGVGVSLPSSGSSVESGFGGTELTAVPDERQQLSITVDSRTNSLIVSGTPTYLDLVAQVVDELDALEANEREVYVYQLRNATAADVAKVVSEFVDLEQKKLIGTLSVDQLGSAARLLEREVTIQGDTQSNTVLVSASPRYMDRVKEMIRKLDVDPPQVLIQVMLAEVTLDTGDDWGVDMRVHGEIDGADITGSFGLGSAFVTGLGVPTLAITSSDFDLLIRAMKSQGRLQVLSNPSIMAANNAPARIQIGETVRLPSMTSISDTGQVSTSLEKEELGVILKVTPSINPDGFVRMVINPEISSLSQRTTQVSEDFESPIITRRTADTTVTVHDGQTIVLGGLISDRYERRDRMVPFFGELPLIGVMFRSNTESTEKTELLIVLTPRVIESPTNFGRVDSVTEREIDRLSVPDEVKQSIRRGHTEGTGGLYNAKGERIDIKPEAPPVPPPTPPPAPPPAEKKP